MTTTGSDKVAVVYGDLFEELVKSHMGDKPYELVWGEPTGQDKVSGIILYTPVIRWKLSDGKDIHRS